MVVSLLKIKPQPAKESAVIDLLNYILVRTRINPQCLDCSVYRDNSDDSILYLEKWQDMEAFGLHIKSSYYMSILAAMELSTSQPEISVSESKDTDAMELIIKLRSG